MATPTISVAAPATPVLVPQVTAGELSAAVREALSNVDRHAGSDARAWVLLEDLGGEVVLSIRDDGVGIPDGRLAIAEAEGHLGVSQSIRGRIADLGGTVELTTAPGEGTEWELHVPTGGAA
jgi:signal transduction histidine kinase